MKIETEILLSINVHEKVNFLLKQIDNIKEYLSTNYYIILNCNDYMYSELKNTVLPENVIVNNEVINKKCYTGKLTEGIYSNMKYANEHFNFKYFIILSSRNLFYSKLDIDILNQKQKIYSSMNEIIEESKNKNENKNNYNEWHWPSLVKTLLAKYYLEKDLNLICSCHEGLVFHYYVCKNILNFLEKNIDFKEDLFNFDNAVEEFSLQSISINEINPENLYYGFFQINKSVETDYTVPTDPNYFVYKTIRE